MPKHRTSLQIFIASPTDVSEERTAVESVIAELNRTFTDRTGISFEAVRWETHVRPGMSSDPQAVVNAQIRPDYDIFLGIFWSRLGTETPRAASGTVEELEHAIQRFQTLGSPEIMIYFKEAPIQPSKIDPEQFSSLHKFKESLGGRGIFFSTFSDTSGFEASLRSHLAAAAQQISAHSDHPSTSGDGVRTVSNPVVTQLVETVDSGDINDEEGLFDYLDTYTVRAQDMVSAISAINEATATVGERLGQGASELNADGGADQSRVRKNVSRAAEEMSRYSDTLGVQTEKFASARREAYSALSGAISVMVDFESDAEELIGLRNTLADGLRSSQSAKDGIMGMRSAAFAIPRMTKDLNQSKRQMCTRIDEFVSEIEGSESTVKSILDALDRLIATKLKPKPDNS